jgi:UDP-N-acetylmuramoylalanine-D-glutamate ligase
VARADDLPAAVAMAAAASEEGDVVLLAPGGTSFDAYEDFASRGRHFRAIVGERAGKDSQRDERNSK